MSSKGKLVVVSGPSGVGKSTVAQEALRRTGAQFSVSATTRSPRPGEKDGTHYHFVSRERFEEMIRQGELLEWAEVFGNYYGTPRGPIDQALTAGRTVLLDIDVQGGVQVFGRMPQARFVLIVPPDEKTLAERLSGRGTEDAPALERRLAQAHREISAARDSGVYQHEIVNDNLENAIRQLVEIVDK